ncbi:MAG: glutamate--tRNA ligase [Actinomycetia bacterium]|nr:glutamate--tRNA ligase [Actinomycetes bacterium]
MSVRVRFAPSPTGYLHVGAARTALYNYLFARHNGGVFVLRSDDTDKARSTDEFQDDILEHLGWLGLEWDEGIVVGGPHGTYRQSDRYDRYREVAHQLVREGHAYYSLATPDQLDEFKQRARDAGSSPAYDGSLEPRQEEISKRLADGETAVIRFRVPRPGETTFVDVVRGDMRFDHAQVDDFVILRSDGTPTYHLASTVDDVDYEITHVIRGEDLLSSTPKHILLTAAMGADPATYAHLSLLFGPDGKKLSKRHGDTAMAAYREAGYLPEAMNNYLALLGWNVGDDETIVPLDEMVKRFDLSSVSKNPAVFDHKKLEWMNGRRIREMSTPDLLTRARPFIERARIDPDLPWVPRALEALQPRANTLAALADGLSLFADHGPVDYDAKAAAKFLKPESRVLLTQLAAALDATRPFVAPAIEETVRAFLESRELKMKHIGQPARVALVGGTASPSLFDVMEIFGRDVTLARLRAAAAWSGPEA